MLNLARRRVDGDQPLANQAVQTITTLFDLMPVLDNLKDILPPQTLKWKLELLRTARPEQGDSGSAPAAAGGPTGAPAIRLPNKLARSHWLPLIHCVALPAEQCLFFASIAITITITIRKAVNHKHKP